jgi:type 1 fimbria pilin
LNGWFIGDYLDADVATFKITISLVSGPCSVSVGDGVTLGTKSHRVSN